MLEELSGQVEEVRSAVGDEEALAPLDMYMQGLKVGPGRMIRARALFVKEWRAQWLLCTPLPGLFCYLVCKLHWQDFESLCLLSNSKDSAVTVAGAHVHSF